MIKSKAKSSLLSYLERKNLFSKPAFDFLSPHLSLRKSEKKSDDSFELKMSFGVKRHFKLFFLSRPFMDHCSAVIDHFINPLPSDTFVSVLRKGIGKSGALCRKTDSISELPLRSSFVAANR